MFDQLHLDLARVRYAEMLEQAERDRRSNEALRILRADAPGRSRPRLNLAWLSRLNPRGLRRAAADTAP
jgi:hypothetical protein